MQYHIILLLVIFYRVACVRWTCTHTHIHSHIYEHICRLFYFGLHSAFALPNNISQFNAKNDIFLSPHLTIYLILSIAIAHLWQDGSFSVCHLQFFCRFFLCYVSFIRILNLVSTFNTSMVCNVVFLHLRPESMQQINLNWRSRFFFSPFLFLSLLSHSYRSIAAKNFSCSLEEFFEQFFFLFRLLSKYWSIALAVVSARTVALGCTIRMELIRSIKWATVLFLGIIIASKRVYTTARVRERGSEKNCTKWWFG